MAPRVSSPSNMPSSTNTNTNTNTNSSSSSKSSRSRRTQNTNQQHPHQPPSFKPTKESTPKVSFDTSEDIESISNFYAPSSEVTYSEQEGSLGGYMTGEEHHADEDDSMDPFAMSTRENDPHQSTPKQSNHSSKSLGQSSSVDADGVKLNSVMAALLDISFLPFDHDQDNDEEEEGQDLVPRNLSGFSDLSRPIPTFENSEDFFSSDDECEDGDGDGDDGSDLDINEDSNEVELIDLGYPPLPKDKRNNSSRRKGKLRKLRRRLNSNPKKMKRKHRKLSRSKQKHRNLIRGLSDSIVEEVQKIESGRQMLQRVKSNLRSTQMKGKRLMSEAQQSASRMNRLSKTVSDLELKLELTMRSLDRERINVDSNLKKLARLNVEEQAMVSQAMTIEENLRNQLNRLENRVVENHHMPGTQVIDVNVSELSGVSYDESTPRSVNANVRVRANSTDGSFMTATEPQFVPLNEEIGSRRRCSSDYGGIPPESVIAAKAQIPLDSTDDENTLPRISSFIRIHDLDIDENAVEATNCSRPDLFPIHSNDCHHVLKALMDFGLKCATDESSRWVPDRSTEKILSKQQSSGDTWYCPGRNDLFVWSGNFDSGYKSDVPVVKARAIVPTSARRLIELLVDSSRVKEYNKMSLGREDLHFIKEGIDTDDGLISGEVKICRSLSSVPIIRKKLELLTLMHARALNEEDEMKGYICVNRSSWEDEDRAPTGNNDESTGNESYIRSEALLGVNLVREINENECEITTISHFYSPASPSFGAKTIGMKAAANFLRDLQKQFKD